MARADARDYVSMECEGCGSRNYRTSKKLKGATYKLELRKFCPKCRQHKVHKEKKK